jgi:hypothetical protein
MFLLAAGSLVVALTAWGDDGHAATQPVTAPAAPPQVRPMDRSYDVLLTFSIFSRDHKPAPVVFPTARPADPNAPLAPESGYVLRGVGMADDRPTAFFQTTYDQHVTAIHLGDPILHGVVSGGSLDGIDYVVNGKATHVKIGQSLEGGVAVATPTTAPADGAVTPTRRWAKSHHAD